MNKSHLLILLLAFAINTPAAQQILPEPPKYLSAEAISLVSKNKPLVKKIQYTPRQQMLSLGFSETIPGINIEKVQLFYRSKGFRLDANLAADVVYGEVWRAFNPEASKLSPEDGSERYLQAVQDLLDKSVETRSLAYAMHLPHWLLDKDYAIGQWRQINEDRVKLILEKALEQSNEGMLYLLFSKELVNHRDKVKEVCQAIINAESLHITVIIPQINFVLADPIFDTDYERQKVKWSEYTQKEIAKIVLTSIGDS